MIEESATTKCFKIKINPIAETFDEEEVVDLWFCLPSQYPGIPPLLEIEGHGGLSTQKADKLYSILMQEACSRLHLTMIYDLIIIAQEFVQKAMKELRARKQRDKLSIRKEYCDESENSVSESDNTESVDASSVVDYGIDLYDTKKYIGHLHNILLKVPSHLKIKSLENIMRYSLVERFNQAWSRLQRKYALESRKFPQQFVTTPTVAFHGTPKGNIPNIVRKGLLVPGKESGVEVAHGSSLGVGIYLSPYPEYSFGYCDAGGTVLVCAVLKGHVNRLGSKLHLSKRCDCISLGDMMVIYDASHVLPCYVITLVPNDSPISVDETLSRKIEKARETQDERKKRIAARSKKFLPYGFGPQSGNQLMVLDAADSDDDEEESGSYQNERYANVRQGHEYQDYRS